MEAIEEEGEGDEEKPKLLFHNNMTPYNSFHSFSICEQYKWKYQFNDDLILSVCLQFSTALQQTTQVHEHHSNTVYTYDLFGSQIKQFRS
jgi:hypothetical protein